MKTTALITGASSGIGKELARIHAENGGNLIIVARSANKLNQLKNELEEKYSGKVHVIAKDLANPNAPKEIYEEVQNQGLQIDFLINNAGFGGRGKFHERPWEKDLAMINLNITALTALTRYFLPHMVQRNKGKILNVSSPASFMPGPLQAVYYASKAYVTFFSNALSEELHDTQVTVTNLMPGATETEFAKISGMEETSLFNKTVSAVSVAKDGYKGMLVGKLDVISGLTFPQKMMKVALPFIPKKVLLSQIRKMQEVS
ncbi:SDR family NAD(P)-dependent oxidoreductase [Xanthovirga aplysinae]|uniref:SDR family NAD(P)-dependent oxidoreductase n=1 Tax=Xanthovirga aplysinae TaxID=2529853 RepID=UPI0012BB769A|nr:SDR family oxidoreductase [Xanthovirga aplysinae]MTI31546.1 SDR family oxidoreductase [Xanthovirga aplysinae]